MIRRLGPGDEAVLDVLAVEEPDFDMAGTSSPREPTPDPAGYLADPALLHLVAEEDGRVVGHLMAFVERRRAGEAKHVLLYEIGVRASHRRGGLGRALVAAMREWMVDRGIRDAWVLSTPEAEPFYAACGFARDDLQPVQMTLRAR